MSAGVTYRFVRCVGRGGFGEVYLAHRRTADGLERRVAMKVLRPDLQDSGLAMARLTDEARLLTILDHPSIVAAFELTKVRGRVALVTEYIEGIDLSRFCVGPVRLPARVVISAIAEVASALDCAFNTLSPENGKPLRLVHRDVKPENVRISKHGEIKLLDFGIARSHEIAREARTSTGNLPFTPGYTAPEGFVALKQEPPTDVFALGATAYRLLTGQRFYEGVRLTDQAALSIAPDQYGKYLDERIALLPPVQPSIGPLLRSCLAYDPTHRPSSSALRGRAESLSEVLAGPTPKRWARDTTFPEERAYDDADLLGLELTEDSPGDTRVAGRVSARTPNPSATPSPAPRARDGAGVGSAPSAVVDSAATVRLSRQEASPVPALARPFPWIPVALGFGSLAFGVAVLGIAAFAAGVVIGW